MHEFEGVEEPTREGRWQRHGPTEVIEVEVYRHAEGYFCYHSTCGLVAPCKSERVTWTGPIPVPKLKDKPPSDEELGRHAMLEVAAHMPALGQPRTLANIGAAIRVTLGGK